MSETPENLPQNPVEAPASDIRPAADSKNPYVGPRPFELHERQLFFGRDWEAEELVALIVAHPVVLFYAQSGAGKSSLLNARIVPKLEAEEGCEVLPVARVRGDIPVGIQAEQIENLYAFNALLNWTEETAVTPEQLVNLSLAEFLNHLPHRSDKEGYPALRILILFLISLRNYLPSTPSAGRNGRSFLLRSMRPWPATRYCGCCLLSVKTT
jgi:hypothetical protein